jgi:hypothetical protein
MRTGGKYRDKIHVTITGAAGDPPSCRHDLKADAVVTYRTFKTKQPAEQCPHCRRHVETQVLLGNWLL